VGGRGAGVLGPLCPEAGGVVAATTGGSAGDSSAQALAAALRPSAQRRPGRRPGAGAAEVAVGVEARL